MFSIDVISGSPQQTYNTILVLWDPERWKKLYKQMAVELQWFLKWLTLAVSCLAGPCWSHVSCQYFSAVGLFCLIWHYSFLSIILWRKLGFLPFSGAKRPGQGAWQCFSILVQSGHCCTYLRDSPQRSLGLDYLHLHRSTLVIPQIKQGTTFDAAVLPEQFQTICCYL